MPRILPVSCLLLCLSLSSFGQSGRVQVIHNAADTALTRVDVWVDTARVADDLIFRRATSFLDVEDGPHNIYVTHKDSNSTINALLTDSFHFGLDTSYVFVLGGFISAGYNPPMPLEFHIKEMAHESAANSGNTDILFFNGCSDFPDVDLVETTEINAPLVTNLPYGAFNGYQEIEAIHYRVSLELSNSGSVLREYDVKLASLGLEDSAIVALTSGFLHPDSNNNGVPYSLFYALPQGGPLLAFPVSVASVQFIHNAADPSLAALDVYANSNGVVNDLGFRSASSFVGIPSGIDIQLSAAPGVSSGWGDSLHSESYVFEAATDYTVVIQGLNDVSIQPFEPLAFQTFPSKRTASLGYNTEITMVHGSTNAPNIVVEESQLLNSVILGPLSYGEREEYIELPSAQYGIKLLPEGSGEPIRSYFADLTATPYAGKAVTWLLSGFESQEVADSTREIGIWVSTATGGPMVELDRATGLTSQPSEVPFIYPNPTVQDLYIDPTLRVNKAELRDALGRSVLFTQEHTHHLRLDGLPDGAYILTLQSDRGTSVHKVMVVH